MARRGATTRDPRRTATPARGTQPAPTQQQAAPAQQRQATQQQQAASAPTFKYEENKAAYEGLTPEQKQRYQRLFQNKDRKAANEYLAKVSGAAVRMPGQKAAAAPTGPAAPTPESVTQEGFMGAGEAYQGIVDRFQGFDPYQVQQQYEPGFQQEMEKARQNVLGQFERRNQRQFEQQRTSLQQQIAERGLDPASPAAQELTRQQNEREDMARQEAMSAAEQAAYSVQQQGFGQAGQLAMMPYEQWQAIQQPYIAGISAQYGRQDLSAQQQFAAQEAEKERRNRLQLARMARSGGGGGGGQPALTPYQRMELENLGQGYNQGQQQNPYANVAQGVVAGATQGVTNWALK
jgi:hypothetical protein